MFWILPGLWLEKIRLCFGPELDSALTAPLLGQVSLSVGLLMMITS